MKLVYLKKIDDEQFFLLHDETKKSSAESIYINTNNGTLLAKYTFTIALRNGIDHLFSAVYNGGQLSKEPRNTWTFTAVLDLSLYSSGQIDFIDSNGIRLVFKSSKSSSMFYSVDGNNASVFVNLCSNLYRYTVNFLSPDHSLFYFDESGRLTEQYYTNSNVVVYRYSSSGKLESIKNIYTNIVACNYEGSRLISLSNENDDVLACFEYDRFGRLISSSNKNGKKTSFFYDSQGSLCRVELPLPLNYWWLRGETVSRIDKYFNEEFNSLRFDFFSIYIIYKSCSLSKRGGSFAKEIIDYIRDISCTIYKKLD